MLDTQAGVFNCWWKMYGCAPAYKKHYFTSIVPCCVALYVTQHSTICCVALYMPILLYATIYHYIIHVYCMCLYYMQLYSTICYYMYILLYATCTLYVYTYTTICYYILLYVIWYYMLCGTVCATQHGMVLCILLETLSTFSLVIWTDIKPDCTTIKLPSATVY